MQSLSKKVFVGLSGGVDSSVTALLLQKAGYDVSGVFIKTWQPDYIECTWKQDRLDAMRVAAQLGIKFVTLDLEAEYKKFVIDYFLSEYKNNRTPNPDIMCNKHIKFGAFLDYALASGADFVATGHYAKIVGGTELFAAKDQNKDQTYFLYQIKKDKLNRILFPLADLEKSVIRKIAKKNNLWVADKKDSQGICMLGGDVSVKDFLIRELSPKKGDVCIKDIKGNNIKIGRHDGAILYTIGERHGFVVNKKQNTNQDTTPYFVIEKDLENNVLIVSQDIPKQNTQNKIKLEEVNILIDINNGKNISGNIFGEAVYARSRYRGELFKVLYNTEDNSVKILKDIDSLDKKYESLNNKNITCVSGQSLVMYDASGRLLGGGVIV